MRSHLTRPILSALFVVWLFFVLASFFAVQKPFTAANAAAIGRAALDIMVAIWVVLAGLGPGVWLLRRLNAAANLPRLDALVLGAGLGLGLLGLLSLGLGLLGLYRPTVAYGVTLALSLVSAKFLYDCRAQSPLPTAGGRLSAVGGPFPAAYLLLYLVLALLTALLPPTDWDGLFYHLTGPKIYLQAGGIIGGVDLPHLNFPSLMEMLFAWAMLLRGDVAAKLLHLVYGLLLAGLVYGLARRFLGEKAGWRALLVAAGMPMLGTLAGWAYNDLALAFYQLAALYAFIHWTQTGANQRISESASRRISESAIANSSFIPSASLRTSPHPSSFPSLCPLCWARWPVSTPGICPPIWGYWP